ncbi:unnamed protein product [Nesidiocoris tenuis]|uniref:Uncharacterized protein n=1 Tax=Nesidiocoris tenuis TaxID=355587 RepID=A0A6H5GVQ5_9HEMI|nr:unnamed protein product [Nesidiocoris tenuis]
MSALIRHEAQKDLCLLSKPLSRTSHTWYTLLRTMYPLISRSSIDCPDKLRSIMSGSIELAHSACYQQRFICHLFLNQGATISQMSQMNNPERVTSRFLTRGQQTRLSSEQQRQSQIDDPQPSKSSCFKYSAFASHSLDYESLIFHGKIIRPKGTPGSWITLTRRICQRCREGCPSSSTTDILGPLSMGQSTAKGAPSSSGSPHSHSGTRGAHVRGTGEEIRYTILTKMSKEINVAVCPPNDVKFFSKHKN